MALAVAAPASVPMRRTAIVAAMLALLASAPRVAAGPTNGLARVSVASDSLDPQTGAQWFALGHSLYHARRYRESVSAFERGLQLRGDGAPAAAWNIARGYAQLGNRKQTLRWLTHARELGFRDDRSTRDEPAFDKFRGDPGFNETVSPSSCSSCRMRLGITVLI
jgi:tetratricopeptide (TPR) repeat protein